jgi:tRNA-splicing endonuclease subunit Sen34
MTEYTTVLKNDISGSAYCMNVVEKAVASFELTPCADSCPYRPVIIMTSTPDLPIAISLIDGRYFLFSADVVSYLRREHRICGVLIGSIPQIPQQNVFLGLPLELMPEEAQLLTAKNVAYVVDDAKAHDKGLQNLDQSRRRDYLTSLQQAGQKAAKSQAEFRGQRKEQALKKRGVTLRSDDVEPEAAVDGDHTFHSHASTKAPDTDPGDSLFSPPSNPPNPKSNTLPALALTPATSYLLLPTPPSTPPLPLPNPPPSYPLFAHLHAKGYFLSPGLRFGCQYVVYPGDPLRFHSHFLAVAVDWDQEIELMDIVGGGRLGTGVKKGYLIGGKEPGQENVRTFSVEWAVM